MTLETIYEVVRIKQEVRELKATEKFYANSHLALAKIAYDFIGEDDREVFLVMCLNIQNQVIAVHKAHIGDIQSTIATAREIFKTAILNNSVSIAFAHNHPSTNIMPSTADIDVTGGLIDCGKILGIPVIDHVIINIFGEYYSMREEGDMDI